jgi:hypothetical protein
MKDAGITPQGIADATGISRRWIGEYADNFEANAELVAWFRENRANAFAHQQAQDISLINRIRGVKFSEENLTDEQILAMSFKDADSIMQKAMVRVGISFDKEQVERSKGVDDVNKYLDIIMKVKQLKGQGWDRKPT